MQTHFYMNETRSVLSLALIFAFRMLGLFMILPIFSVATGNLSGVSPALVGLALGIYGLTQAIFQIPLSTLSDHIGRKPVIAAGLLLFFLGSVVAAKASSIYGIILGRAVQGAGAIGSVILALLADVTKIENRTRAMAVVGMSIGFSFMLAMLIGPIIYEFAALTGLFWSMAVLALLGLLILQFAVKSQGKLVFHQDVESSFSLFKRVLLAPELMRLNLGILVQHAILTASFIAIPKVLSQSLHLPVSQYWMFYLPVLLLSALGAFPLILLSEKRRFVRGVLLGSISILSITQILLAVFHLSFLFVLTVLSIFFFAFTLLEAFLPSLISKIAPIQCKGTAMGIYSTSQFLGIFLGGSVGGIILMHFGLNGVFWFCGILAILWLLVAIPMKSPPYLTTRIYRVDRMTVKEAKALSQQFLSAEGVSEAAVIPEEGAVYLKVDLCSLDETYLQNIMNQFNVEKDHG